jgi:hypothetical protein
LKDYIWRFNQEKLDTESVTEDFIYGALYQGIRKDGALIADLARKLSKDLHRLMNKVDKYIN